MCEPLPLVGPELTGVVVGWGGGDVLGQKVGQRQFGENVCGPVHDGGVDHLQEDRRHAVRTAVGARPAAEDQSLPAEAL